MHKAFVYQITLLTNKLSTRGVSWAIYFQRRIMYNFPFFLVVVALPVQIAFDYVFKKIS